MDFKLGANVTGEQDFITKIAYLHLGLNPRTSVATRTRLSQGNLLIMAD